MKADEGPFLKGEVVACVEENGAGNLHMLNQDGRTWWIFADLKGRLFAPLDVQTGKCLDVDRH